MAKELKIEPGSAPEPELPTALKLFPERLVELGNRHEMETRKQIAEIAGRHPSQVGRWLKYEGLGDLAASALIGLENGFGLTPGTLLSPYPIELRSNTSVVDVLRAAEAMGIAQSVARALSDGSGETMREFAVELKHAVLGAVHLLGFPLESASRAAQEALSERLASHGSAEGLSAEMWLTALRPYLRGKPESGTYPSSSKIKIK